MAIMTSEHQKIIDEAFATLERVASIKKSIDVSHLLPPESEPEQQPKRRLTDTEASLLKAELANLVRDEVASERTYLFDEILPELFAEFSEKIKLDMEQVFAKKIAEMQAIIDSMERRIFSSSGGVTELPHFLSDRARVN
jgi:hypothetical protein